MSILQLSESFFDHVGVIDEESGYPVYDDELFSDSIYQQQTQLAERELASFISAVTQLYGPEQATFSENDWLDEADSMDTPPFSTERDWRAVTIAASARLANRLSLDLNQRSCATS